MFTSNETRVHQVNLENISKRLIERLRWRQKRLENTETEYRRFLFLFTARPGHAVVPWSKDLDLFWHEHILDTQAYAAMCKTVVGRYVHHDPNIDADPARARSAQYRTALLYYRTFYLCSYERKHEWGKVSVSTLLKTTAALGLVLSFDSASSSGAGTNQSSSAAAGCGAAASCGGCAGCAAC